MFKVASLSVLRAFEEPTFVEVYQAGETFELNVRHGYAPKEVDLEVSQSATLYGNRETTVERFSEYLELEQYAFTKIELSRSFWNEHDLLSNVRLSYETCNRSTALFEVFYPDGCEFLEYRFLDTFKNQWEIVKRAAVVSFDTGENYQISGFDALNHGSVIPFLADMQEKELFGSGVAFSWARGSSTAFGIKLNQGAIATLVGENLVHQATWDRNSKTDTLEEISPKHSLNRVLANLIIDTKSWFDAWVLLKEPELEVLLLDSYSAGVSRWWHNTYEKASPMSIDAGLRAGVDAELLETCPEYRILCGVLEGNENTYLPAIKKYIHVLAEQEIGILTSFLDL